MAGKIYFKGLNGIRAIACLIVLFWHTDQFTYLFDINSIGIYENGMADNAVNLFFVLSGFLITFLLLVEKKKTGTINLKKFYYRRIYRIWPLYYMAILIALILIYFEVLPNDIDLFQPLFLYLFLLANVALILKISLTGITPLWSVGVEEQYYLIWPLIVKKTSNYLKTFIFLITFFISLKIGVFFLFSDSSFIFKFLSVTRIDLMVMGGVGGFCVYTNHVILNFIYKKNIQILAYIVLFLSIIYKPIHVSSFIDSELNSLFYLIIILNVSTNKNTIISFENKFFNFIGKISYGIYIYHMFVIYLYAEVFNSKELNYVVLQIVILISTILIFLYII